jgi:hypothetical protein
MKAIVALSAKRKLTTEKNDFFDILVSFSAFHRNFQFVSFFSWGRPRIESQQ